ncbi:MAG: hypothetical protein QNK37_17625 [Acidobacteriota bacterium]|nr:hypothetical protein [Acidobacteriota bacterium]
MKRLLIIDPGFYSRVQMDDELSPQGFQVTAVKTVESALMKMKTQIFQALLVSFDEQAEDTLRMLLALRESFNFVPAVILTRKPTEQNLARLLRFRPIEIVVKPYSLVDLVARIDALIRARNEEQQK